MFDQDYTIPMRGFVIKVSGSQLSAFATRHKLSDEIHRRISELFWLDLYVYFEGFNVDPDNILCEIRYLENGTPRTETKAAAPFLHKPLKGLCHKHWFAANFVPGNILNAYNDNHFGQEVEALLASPKALTDPEGLAKDLANKLTFGAFEGRAHNNKLTGQWIVFAQHDQKNYYLCLNTHEAGNQAIFDRINSYCTKDFPFLSALLAGMP